MNQKRAAVSRWVFAIWGLLLSCLPVQAAVVLQYHHVSDATPASTSTTPALFRQHMEYLESEGYEVVSLPELLEGYTSSEDDRAKRVAITFDDGYSSVYTTAYPELKKRGWPFTVFVNTKPLDEHWKEFTDWDQLREMAANGATIANHTVNHGHLIRRQEGESEEEWRQRIKEDLLLAEKRIKQETGQNHRILAYPFGEYDLALMKLLKSLDFVGFGQHSGPLGSSHSPQALPRFPFGGHYGDISDFAQKASTLPMPLESVFLETASSEDVAIEPLLPPGDSQPKLVLNVGSAALAQTISCFATGQGRVDTHVDDQRVEIELQKPLPAGRSRINCTAAAGEGRFYWFSQPFFQPDKHGEWPPE
ncbi:polysaccharide deacetylase family protein [Pseudomaricurvus sp.]|uniref:polysaccharide deacetylase family protein n=1 Tax=Pseudomaricurvus sp. TaxID=2004510 RepID=UPI003F6C7E41